MNAELEYEDPIIEELHQIRRDLIREHGGMRGLMRHLESWHEVCGDRLVTNREAPLPDLSKFWPEDDRVESR